VYVCFGWKTGVISVTARAMVQPPPAAHEVSRTIVDRKADLLDLSQISPAQAAALWKVGLLPPEEIGTLAGRWLEQGEHKGSPELASIALSPPSSLSAVGRAFETALREMGVDLPNVAQGVLVTLELYLRAIIEGRVPPMTGMAAINELYYDRGEAELSHPNRQDNDRQNYLGEELGLEHLYTWYRELQDAADGSTLFYYNELPREQQLAKFEEEVIAEARVLHRHLCNIHPNICAAAPF
jgi:hypothetical protein